MTKRELNCIRTEIKLFHPKLKWKQGYCCYQEDNCSEFELIELGTNHGLYGWNWSLFFCERTHTFYVSGYRNY